jgi:hypothetical protein
LNTTNGKTVVLRTIRENRTRADIQRNTLVARTNSLSPPTEGELAAETTLLPDKTKIKDIATAFSSFLKLPAAGAADTPKNVGSKVYLWTKTVGLAPPSFQACALFEPSSSTFTQSKGLFVDLTNSLLAGVILEASDRSKDDRLPVRCIQTQATISFKSQFYKEITSRYTGRVWLELCLSHRRLLLPNQKVCL